MLLDCDRGPLELKRHIRSSRTSPVLFVEGLPLREPNDDLLLFSSSSLQGSGNQTRSPIAVTSSRSIFSLLIDWTIEGTIISHRNTAASVSRFSSVKMSFISFALNKAIHGMFFGSLVTISEPSSSSRSRRLFVSNLLHSFYCFEYNFTVTVTLYFQENFMVDDKLQDRKWLSAYNRVLCIYNSCWLS